MWDKIIGHERQKEQLRHTIEANSFAHAYLFSGIDGIGKKLIAYAAASELLGKKVAEGGAYPDLIEIKPEKDQITISSIREVKDQLKFAPLEGVRRVIIIDKAEAMNPSAANAALKILEEPPAGNHFFLITWAPNQLLPTIISRCQKMPFSPLTAEQVEQYLTLQHGYSPEQAKTAAGVCEGSIGRALNITPELVDSMIDDLMRLFNDRTATAILDTSEKWSAQKEEIDNILYVVHRSFHRALVKCHSCVNRNPEPTDALSPRPPISVEGKFRGDDSFLIHLILSKNGPDQLVEKCDLINQTHAMTSRTYNKQLMFEQLLFTLTG